MLDAKDLRIGNLFTLNNPHYRPKENGLLVSVTSIDTNRNEMNEDGEYEPKVAVGLLVVQNNKFYENRFAQWIEYLKPIELTEEWLLDFGYKQVNTLANGTKVLEKPGLFTVYYKDGIVRFSFYTIDVKFVHKFQNIIYSLTNTELTLKDEK
jgi:hypothetical protein